MKKTLADFQPLKSAEQKLLECCQRGEIAFIGEERPIEKIEANEIRAVFIRWLILTKEVEIDPNGIQMQGAWISGVLDVKHARCEKILYFMKCYFEETLNLIRTIAQSIYLEGTFCQKGILGDGLICQGSLYIRNNFEANSEIRFTGANVEGSFDCSEGIFKAPNEEKKALCCNSMIVNGSVFLRGTVVEGEVDFIGAQVQGSFDCSSANFKVDDENKIALYCDGMNILSYVFLRYLVVRGQVNFTNAKIGRDFDCMSANFSNSSFALVCERINVVGNVYLNQNFCAEGQVDFVGAQVQGSFDCSNANFKVDGENVVALNCEDMKIVGGMNLRNKCIIEIGYINWINVNIGSLFDNEDFWKQETLKHVELDGFKYGHIYGTPSASFRLYNMLGKMPKDEFAPQPYKQLAKVLRDMGHDRDADEVMIALRDKQLEESKESRTYKVLRKFYKWTSGYGYRPIRTLKAMTLVWFLFGCIYWYGANVAVFAPTNPLIFQKDYNCMIDKNGTKWLASPKNYNESNNWYIASPAEYTTFQPFWYSLDIILPVVDLKMENDWGIVIPSPEGDWTDMIPFTTTNHFIRFLTWIEALAGWGLSLMLIAILSGLAKNEKE